MTTKPKPRKEPIPTRTPKRRARALTEAEFAAMDFEPWEGEINTKFLPSKEQFTEDGLFHLITCRMALVMMYKTKAELSEIFEQNGDAACELVENMGKAKDFFLHFFKLLDAAQVRLFAAGSSVCQNTPEKCAQRGREWGNA